MSIEVTHDDLTKLRDELTANTKVTSELQGTVRSLISSFNRVFRLLEGNGQSGLIKIVASQETELKGVVKEIEQLRKDEQKRNSTTWQWVMFVALAVSIAVSAFL